MTFLKILQSNFWFTPILHLIHTFRHFSKCKHLKLWKVFSQELHINPARGGVGAGWQASCFNLLCLLCTSGACSCSPIAGKKTQATRPPPNCLCHYVTFLSALQPTLHLTLLGNSCCLEYSLASIFLVFPPHPLLPEVWRHDSQVWKHSAPKTTKRRCGWLWNLPYSMW